MFVELAKGEAEKDLGMVIHLALKMSSYCGATINEGNRMMNYTGRAAKASQGVMLKLCTALVIVQFECCLLLVAEAKSRY